MDSDAQLPDSLPSGFLMKQEIPSDNSCLFRSIKFCVSNGKESECNPAEITRLRNVIAQHVSSDPELYCEAFLGKSNKEYCEWIRQEDKWGGAIEISILSQYFKVEIVVVDTKSCQLMRFGEDMNYSTRILLIYDGIHYDALIYELDSSPGTRICQFSRKNHFILDQALQIAREAKSSRQFTDTKSFTLQCSKCDIFLKGETEAREHAKSTKHVDFREV